MDRNRDVIYGAADWIEQHPDRYSQHHWSDLLNECGTAYCIGGTVLHLDGWEADRYGVWTRDNDPEIVYQSVPATAAALMGLPKDEASILFNHRWQPADGYTVPEALRRIADGVPVLAMTCQVIRKSLAGTEIGRECDEWVKAHA